MTIKYIHYLYRLVLYTLICLFFSNCKKNEAEPKQLVYTENVLFSGWGSGGPYYVSPRNHHYKFAIDGPQTEIKVHILSTTLNLRYFVYTESQYHSGIQPPEVDYTVVGQKQQQFTLKNKPAGNYVLIIGTDKIGDKGDYTISIDGLSKMPTKTSFVFLEKSDQIWSEDGSGGGAYFGQLSSDNFLSERNPRYTFTVSQDSWVDIELVGSNGDIRGALYDDQGNQIYTYGDLIFGSASTFGIQYLKAGNYTLVVASFTPNVKGAFNLKVSGHISDIKRKEAHVKVINDHWGSGEATYDIFLKKSNDRLHVYQIDIVNTINLDIILVSSKQASTSLFLHDQRDQFVDGQNLANGASIARIINGGRYYLLVITSTIYPFQDIPYKLSIYGDVKEIKKL